MGCGTSSVAVAPRKRNNNDRIKISGGIPGVLDVSGVLSPVSKLGDSKVTGQQIFEMLTNGVNKIASPGNMMPIVCLKRDSFPLATHQINTEENVQTEIQLPIIACSQTINPQNGNISKVVCFSQIDFLQMPYIKTGETQKLLYNAVSWASGGSPSLKKIGILGMNRFNAASIQKNLHDMGFFAEIVTSKFFINKFHSIICTTDISSLDTELLDQIKDFVDVGGGLIVFYKYSDKTEIPIPLNHILRKFGMAYTYHIMNTNSNSYDNARIQIPKSYSLVRDNNFVLITAKFKAIIGQSSIDTSALDDIITMLKYFIMVSDESHLDILEDIYKSSWTYLKESNYRTDEGVCPDIKHGMVTALIQEIMPQLPVSLYHAVPEHSIFPGNTGDVTLSRFDFSFELQSDIWISTGLWLPAGAVGYVEYNGPHIAGLGIQIGSHQNTLFSKQGPLKRMPSVCSFFMINGSVTEVGTCYGGIVYVICSEPVEISTIDLVFKGFTKYPRYCIRNESIWDETKSFDVPWGEVETDSCIFTMPTEEIKKLKNIELINEKFNFISDEISKFMSFEHSFPYRIVFDIENTYESLGAVYPLVFLTQEIEKIVNSWNSPNSQLFLAISVMSVMSIREDCFDPQSEIAISSVCTSSIFRKLFGTSPPSSLPDSLFPKLYFPLWYIHTKCGENIIPDTLAIIQEPAFQLPEIPEDMWVLFVKELCTVGKHNFTSLLDKVHPIPLNISMSLQGLPVFDGMNDSPRDEE